MENNLEKILNPIKSYVDNRMNDPFLGAFVLSFLVWNSYIFLYVFSDLSPDTKYALIINKLNIYSILGPAGISLFYNLGLPFLMYFPNKWAQRLLIINSNAKELEFRKTTTNQAYIQDYRNKIDHLEKRVSDKDREIGQLQQKIEQDKDQQQSQLKLLNQTITELKSKLKIATESKPNSALRTLRKHKLEFKFEELGDLILKNDNRYVTTISEIDSNVYRRLDLIERPPINSSHMPYIKLTDIGKDVMALLISQEENE